MQLRKTTERLLATTFREKLASLLYLEAASILSPFTFPSTSKLMYSMYLLPDVRFSVTRVSCFEQKL